MVTYERFAEELITQGIDKTIVEKLIEEYRIAKKEHLLGDYEKAVLHSAKVSELILALIKNKVSGKVEDVNNLHFNKILEEILKYSKPSAQDVILTLAIPRVAESIYTIRSKKNVAHVKTIDPSFIDSSYCVSACDWMLSELVLLFYKANVNEASELINSILTKKVPTIEEFEDGSLVILRRDLSLKQEFLLALYYDYPKRITDIDLIRKLNYNNFRYAKRILKELEGKKFVHRNVKGNKLTKNGIKYVEDVILTKKASL